jgi:hypothetical protein
VPAARLLQYAEADATTAKTEQTKRPRPMRLHSRLKDSQHTLLPGNGVASTAATRLRAMCIGTAAAAANRRMLCAGRGCAICFGTSYCQQPRLPLNRETQTKEPAAQHAQKTALASENPVNEVKYGMPGCSATQAYLKVCVRSM